MQFIDPKETFDALTQQDHPKHISIRERFQQIAKDKELNKEETIEETALRRLGQYSARAAETFIGMPGSMKKAFQSSMDFIDEVLPTNFKGLREKERELFQPEEGSINDIISNPPTVQETRELGKKYIGKGLLGDENILEPKSENERKTGELVQDIASFFQPGTGQMRLATRIGAPIVGNLAKEGAKYLGSSDDTADKAKLGFMLMTTMAGQSNPAQFAQQRIAQSRNMVPENMTVSALPLADRLMPLYNRTQRGIRGVPSKSQAVRGIQDLADQVQDGRLGMHTLMDARNDINEWIAEAGGWDVPGPVRDRTLANLNELKRQIITTIDENLTQRMPQAAELYRTGYEAAAVTHASNAMSNFIERHFGRNVASAGAKILFPSLAGGAAFLPKTAISGAALYPIYKTGQVMYRVARSPTLARYYQDVLVNSAIGNAPAMIKSMTKFDKEMEKEEKKHKKLNGISLDEFKERFKNKD